MTPVGGSRHYQGGGLGDTLTWGCPSCGADNTGPISQGCQLCGAGKPGQRMTEPPPPPPAEPVAQQVAQQGDVADYWASQQDAGVTLAEAYRAGYRDGVLAARETKAREQAAFPPQTKAARTIVAALALFRDQVLVNEPEEIESGEWCSPQEANELIQQLQQQYEVAHA